MDRNVWIRVIGETVTNSTKMMLMPFFALYLENRVDSMFKVGFIMSIAPIASLFGGMIGGRLADLYGRKRIMVYSTVSNAIILMSFTLFDGYKAYLILSILMGLSNSFFSPASSAMVADVTNQEQRTEAYGLLRVGHNLGTAIGPIIGSTVVFFSKDALFYITSITLFLYSLVLIFFLRETLPLHKPSIKKEPKQQNITTKELLKIILSDKLLIFYITTGIIISMGFSQIEGMLPLYFKQTLSIVFEKWSLYPFLMSINGLLVVLFQFPISGYLSKKSIGKAMYYGTQLFGIGILSFGMLPPLFVLYGTGKLLIIVILIFVTVYYTMGEMVMSPVQMTFVANIAPEHLRATYMAVGGFQLTIGGFLGPLIGGWFFDLKLGLWLFIFLGAGVIIAGLTYRSLDGKVAMREQEQNHALKYL
ncbi:MDR family MFS transporter [Neobacillus ginsengisoli]|nr:MFS transporter [Neobacillus ginsengisoli]